MMKLVYDDDPSLTEEDLTTLAGIEVHSDEVKKYILTELATTFSDDVDFLRKINKLTFGLQSNQ